ncbi:hypothetical protein DBQ68_05470 [Lactobacillus sp. DS15_6]|nr:hypothetical protein F0640_13270 [Lacticaseibacillus paracasei]PTS46905.1 hypothetical protein DBQ69_03245 [Lactobacillus sp. DS1_6]PTS51122.1 hypothetical protein DBQ62_05425 [Lactobacillus sp. DS9_6]PTS52802.1 hypothetical protein DBQ60_03500 [Lactobacillus sp. DS2_6]PTS62889.1 hypothetical protein DBQ68_05470 [Lactobacillus sp. DS15_6]PTS69871.1 hypothetical protein DBQ65_09655 [Lactobacillus sp. DS3_6]PTV41473.1 hypothetical protein DB344_02470 [Lactobacillus sp. DS13_6]PTV41649.1 hyp
MLNSETRKPTQKPKHKGFEPTRPKPCLILLNSETRKPAQKPTHKDPEPKRPKPCRLGSGPLMLRFLSGPVCALQKKALNS